MLIKIPFSGICSLFLSFKTSQKIEFISMKERGGRYNRIYWCLFTSFLRWCRWVPGGTPRHSCRGCAAQFPKSWPYFRPKCHFPLPFSDLVSKIYTRFQTYVSRNYVTITGIRTPAKRFLKIHSKFTYRLSFFFIRNWNDKYVCLFWDSRQTWAKSIPVFRPKRHNDHTLWGGTYLYGLNKRDGMGL